MPLRLAPVEGESLPGYVARYSHTFQFPPGDVIIALGLEPTRRHGHLPPALRRLALTPSSSSTPRSRPGSRSRRSSGMLLSRYASRAFERELDLDRHARATRPQAHEVLIRSSKFCPHCLREHGAWLLSWQLGLERDLPHATGFCSPRAARVRDSCRRTCSRSRWSATTDGPLSDPTRCTRRLGQALCRTAPRRVRACASAATRPSRRSAGSTRCSTVGPCPTFAGEPLEPPIYPPLHARALQAAGPTTPRAPGDRPVSRARGRRLFDRSRHARGGASPTRSRSRISPTSQRSSTRCASSSRSRYHPTAPRCTLGQLGNMLATIRDTLRHALSEAVWAPPSDSDRASPPARTVVPSTSTRVFTRGTCRNCSGLRTISAVAELFDFDDFTHWHGRRICSLLLARMLTPLDWDAAVRYLDFPETFINKGYTTTSVKLRTIGRFDELVHRVKQIANHHAERRTDRLQATPRASRRLGRHRPRHLAAAPIPPRAEHRWLADMPSRRTRASVWLWCELTSGHERAAPIALPTFSLAHQNEFIRDTLPDLRERLLLLGRAPTRHPRQRAPHDPRPARGDLARTRIRNLPSRAVDDSDARLHEPPKPPRVPPTSPIACSHTSARTPASTSPRSPLPRSPGCRHHPQ